MNVNIALKALDSTDIEFARRCRNDFRLMRWCRQKDVISDAEQLDWFQRQKADPTIQMYKIELTVGDNAEPIGVCGFTSISHFNRTAEFSLYIDPKRQREGWGRRALCLLLQHGFQNLGFEVIWGETLDGNPAARLFEALGMVKEGTLRARYWKDSRIWDSHIYSIKSAEWKITSSPSSSSSLADSAESSEPSSDTAAGRLLAAAATTASDPKPAKNKSPRFRSSENPL